MRERAERDLANSIDTAILGVGVWLQFVVGILLFLLLLYFIPEPSFETEDEYGEMLDDLSSKVSLKLNHCAVSCGKEKRELLDNGY